MLICLCSEILHMWIVVLGGTGREREDGGSVSPRHLKASAAGAL